MSETTTETTPEAKQLSYKEFLEQGGQFGEQQREKNEPENVELDTVDAESEVERGLDGKPLATGDWLKLYNQIIDSKVNNPDAGIRKRSADWNLNFKQRYELSDHDLEVLEKEAEEELGRIEAKQKSDEFEAASAEHEAKYQGEMQEVRTDRELYDMFYEAALKQLPEIKSTATDALGQHYEKQQLTAAREKEAARIADVVLTQFKNARAPSEGEPDGDAKKEVIDGDAAATPETTGDTTDTDTKDEAKTLPTLPPVSPPPPLPTPPLTPPPFRTAPTVSFPVPTPPIAPPPPSRGEAPYHPGEPTPEELSGDVEVDDSNEAIRDVVHALEYLLREDYVDENDYPEEYKDILRRAHEALGPRSRWEKIKEGFHDLGRAGFAKVFTRSAAVSSEHGATGEKKKRSFRKYVVGAGALTVAGVGAYFAIKGVGQGDEVGQLQNANASTNPGQLPLVDVDPGSGSQALEFSETARIAEPREGWYQTIMEATGINDQAQLQTVLRDVGPKLIHMGEAYPFDQQLGSYGISKPGRISDEVLHLIHDAAQRRGFLK